MTIWVDAQLSPAIADWIGAVVMTKDGDFARLVVDLGPPPQVLLLTCGNSANARLKQYWWRPFTRRWRCWRRANR